MRAAFRCQLGVILRHRIVRASCHLQLPPLGNLHALRKCAHPSIDCKSLLVQLGQFIPQRRQRKSEALDILVLFQLRPQIPVLVSRIRHIHFEEDHFGVRVAEPGIVEHHKPLGGFAVLWQRCDVAGLFLKLANGAGRRIFAFVDQTAGDFDRDFVEGWPELLLEEEGLAGSGVGEDGDYTDAVCF